MYWWYFLILLFTVAYYGYRKYMKNKMRKQASMPRCEKCGSIMELQVKHGDSEVWVCPKCSGS